MVSQVPCQGGWVATFWTYPPHPWTYPPPPRTWYQKYPQKGHWTRNTPWKGVGTRDTNPPMNRQTPVKTLPARSLPGGSNKFAKPLTCKGLNLNVQYMYHMGNIVSNGEYIQNLCYCVFSKSVCKHTCLRYPKPKLPNAIRKQVCIPVGCVPPASVATVNRMTDRCKNITLPQTSFTGGNKELHLQT